MKLNKFIAGVAIVTCLTGIGCREKIPFGKLPAASEPRIEQIRKEANEAKDARYLSLRDRSEAIQRLRYDSSAKADFDSATARFKRADSILQAIQSNDSVPISIRLNIQTSAAHSRTFHCTLSTRRALRLITRRSRRANWYFAALAFP